MKAGWPAERRRPTERQTLIVTYRVSADGKTCSERQRNIQAASQTAGRTVHGLRLIGVNWCVGSPRHLGSTSEEYLMENQYMINSESRRARTMKCGPETLGPLSSFFFSFILKEGC